MTPAARPSRHRIRSAERANPMTTSAAWLAAALRSGALVPRRPERLAGDRGEGVVSAAIVVLIFAFLGVGMWVAFTTMFENVKDKTCEQVGQIGGPAPAAGAPAAGGGGPSAC
jgi:hypothetical protein